MGRPLRPHIPNIQVLSVKRRLHELCSYRHDLDVLALVGHQERGIRSTEG